MPSFSQLAEEVETIEAMPGGGRLTIDGCALERGPHRVRITFCDDGPGIAPEVLPKMFDPFVTTKETGTGLGLAIVHRIAEAHGGMVTAANNGPAADGEHGGATITLLLP